VSPVESKIRAMERLGMRSGWQTSEVETACRLVVCGLVVVLAGGFARLGAAERPNIILVITDDQRFDALGCMGNPVLKTPHIDGLAARGTLFTHTFCTTSICATSRASFLTGQYAMRHRVRGFRQPLTESQWQDAFPVLLRRAGYHTAMVGKWGLGGPLPRKRYDVFQGFSGQGRYYPTTQRTCFSTASRAAATTAWMPMPSCVTRIAARSG